MYSVHTKKSFSIEVVLSCYSIVKLYVEDLLVKKFDAKLQRWSCAVQIIVGILFKKRNRTEHIPFVLFPKKLNDSNLGKVTTNKTEVSQPKSFP
jgi:hypothetical protein